MDFSDTLLSWFEENQRTLPWRGETDPYKIWVSEIILQQTRVVQGIPYYHNFITHFPTVADLAAASEDAVLKVWQGLGYYSRARNMHTAAKSIMASHGGRFPSSYPEIRALKGIGDYTAAAIASLAFSLPYPAVDGNVLRFVSRYYGIFEDISQSTTRKLITEICQKAIPTDHAGTFNQAMMEMGAIQCVPQNPQCDTCPFRQSCYAYQHQQVDHLPIKEQRLKIRSRYFHYIVYLCDGQTVLQQRTGNDIWKGLFEFPLVETSDSDFSIRDCLFQSGIDILDVPKLLWQKKHVLTHQHIFADFWVVPVSRLPVLAANQQPIPFADIERFAVAKITKEAIDIASRCL